MIIMGMRYIECHFFPRFVHWFLEIAKSWRPADKPSKEFKKDGMETARKVSHEKTRPLFYRQPYFGFLAGRLNYMTMNANGMLVLRLTSLVRLCGSERVLPCWR
jgi:hypothetical protein